jgi:hypothetical protein
MFESFDKKVPPIAPNLLISFDPEQDHNFLENHSYFTEKLSPSNSLKKIHEKDLSVRSISTSKKQQFFKMPQRNPKELEH